MADFDEDDDARRAACVEHHQIEFAAAETDVRGEGAQAGGLQLRGRGPLDGSAIAPPVVQPPASACGTT